VVRRPAWPEQSGMTSGLQRAGPRRTGVSEPMSHQWGSGGDRGLCVVDKAVAAPSPWSGRYRGNLKERGVSWRTTLHMLTRLKSYWPRVRSGRGGDSVPISSSLQPRWRRCSRLLPRWRNGVTPRHMLLLRKVPQVRSGAASTPRHDHSRGRRDQGTAVLRIRFRQSDPLTSMRWGPSTFRRASASASGDPCGAL